MGGSAFAKTLSTPRMPPKVYTRVREETLATLRKFYRYAEAPIEGPEKTDHGDVDILVAEPLGEVSEEGLVEILGAKEVIMVKGSCTTNMALPWPMEKHEEEVSQPPLDSEASMDYQKASDTQQEASFPETPKSQQFIQLDLHACDSYHSMQWELFHQAHGDFWNIVGGMIRWLGLTVSNTGLYIRIEELEGYQKELGRVKLTENPTMVLEFLGLDTDRFWLPFNSLDDMMAYAATCRFHNPTRGADRDKTRAELKANDRQRASKRKTFASWIDDYLPAHRSDPAGAASSMTREEVVQDAKRFFGNETAKCFDRKKAEGVRAWGIEKLWASLRKDLPIDGIEVGYVMKGLKREVTDRNEEGLHDVEIQQDYKDGRFGLVASWAKDNWKEVGERQKALDREKSHRNLMEKVERDRVKQNLEEDQIGADV